MVMFADAQQECHTCGMSTSQLRTLGLKGDVCLQIPSRSATDAVRQRIKSEDGKRKGAEASLAEDSGPEGSDVSYDSDKGVGGQAFQVESDDGMSLIY